MTNTHTPGPWSYNSGSIYQVVDNGLTICHLLPGDNEEANANLIAEAPELLAELEAKEAWMLDHVSTDTYGYDAEMMALRAAIAKARGL